MIINTGGQKVGDDGHVKGALTDADGMLPSQTESYDLGSPTRRYSDYYGRRIFLGENNYSAVDNGVRGLTLAGHQNSIYAFGKADPKREEGRQGFVLTSTWEGNGGSAGLVNGAETYWMMYRKLYVGERDGKGFYDSQAAILDSKNYTIYGARIGCNALLATTVDSENIVCNNLEVKSNLVTPSSSETSDRRLKNKIRKIEKVDLTPIYAYNYTINVGKEDTKKEIPKIGVIAQEVQEVYPDLVTENEGYLAVNYNGLTALLLQKVKELEARIKEWEDKRP
ncbi:MAG: tail fiber domain-containing protein [Tannerellaceae bacterium]|nr:tail fiber domain-containing protein [Tannerellaceae bacterium]